MNLDSTYKQWDKWQQEIKEYGFANYETWSMFHFFFAWLYERLKRYKDVACIDLNYHKFEFEGKEYTQGELIDKMIHGCEIALVKNEYDFSDKDIKIVRDVGHIWAIVMPVMWW